MARRRKTSLARRRRGYGEFHLFPRTWVGWTFLFGGAALGIGYFFRQQIAATASDVVTQAETLAAEISDAPSFAKKVYQAVTAVNPGASETAKLLIIAQAAWETGWGSQKHFSETNNLFNITAGKSWSGDTLRVANADKSYNAADCPGGFTASDANGSYCRIDQVWRKYGSLEDSVRDFLQFIAYASAQLLNGDIQYLQTLYDHKYYTLPSAKYIAGVQSIVNNLPAKLTA